MSRQYRQDVVDAWGAPEDPGLRDRFHELPRAPVRLICGPMNKAVNHGGITRLAETLRLEMVCFQPEDDGTEDRYGAVSAFEWQPATWMPAAESVQQARHEGYHVVGLGLTPDAVPYTSMSWKFPLALVLGEERFGLSPELAEACDAFVAIPMYGMLTSMNVGQAAAVVACHAVAQYAAAHPDFVPARESSRRLLDR